MPHVTRDACLSRSHLLARVAHVCISPTLLRLSYIAPLVFVLAVTMTKEAYDDVQRWRTDIAINQESYERLLPDGSTQLVRAQDIEVGHLIRVHADQRIPADLVMLRTHDASGSAFVRTDQLDGETDWKLRLAVPSCQKLATDESLAAAVLTLAAGAPTKEIYDFAGDVTLYDEAFEGGCMQEPLGLENTLWANTVLASGTACGLVVHTGAEVSALQCSEHVIRGLSTFLAIESTLPSRLLLVCTDAVSDELFVSAAFENGHARSASQSALQAAIRTRHVLCALHGHRTVRPECHCVGARLHRASATAAPLSGRPRLRTLHPPLLADHPDLTPCGVRRGQARLQAADDRGQGDAWAAGALIHPARGARRG